MKSREYEKGKGSTTVVLLAIEETVWIVGSAVEHHIDIVGVTGSIPVRSTKNLLGT